MADLEGHADNLLLYVPWSTIQRWKRENRPAESSKWRPRLPYIYASGSTVFKKYARPNSILWVATCPKYGSYRLAPTVVARLVVKETFPRDGGKAKISDSRIPAWFPTRWSWVAIADSKLSTYFPINNAYSHLKALKSRDQHDTKSVVLTERAGSSLEPYVNVPRDLRFARRLCNDDALADLETFVGQVATRRTVFLSYCRADDQQKIGEFVEALIAEDFTCWLDMKAIPQPVAEGKIRLDFSVLDQVLRDGIRQANMFVAVVGQGYHQSQWTLGEWQEAAKHRNQDGRSCRVQVLLDDPPLPAEVSDPAPIRFTTAKETARSVRQLFVARRP